MKIKISILAAQGAAGPQGKFYIGIEDDRAAATIYGANTAGTSGTLDKHKDAASVIKKLKEKRKTYKDVPVSAIRGLPLQAAADHIRRVYAIGPTVQVDLQNTEIVFDMPGQGTTQGSSRPKRNKFQPTWI